MSGRQARAWPKLGALLGSAALSLAAGEIYVREYHADELDMEKLEAHAEATHIGRAAQASSNPELVYELRPHLDIQWLKARIVTDADGCRVSPQGVVEPADLRVALVGDSVPFGWGVEYEQTYGAVLERLLNERGQHRVRLRNFAVPGYNSIDNRIVTRDKVLPWKPDLVILHYDHNDAQPPGHNPDGFMGPHYGDNPLGSALIKWSIRRAFSIKNLWLSQSILPDQDRPNLRVHGTLLYGGGQYDWHIGQMRKLGRMLEQEGVPTLSLIFYAAVQVEDSLDDNEVYTKLHVPITRELRAHDISVVDSYLVMQDYLRARGWSDMRHTWLHRTDSHPNPETHAFLGRALYDALLAEQRFVRILDGAQHARVH